MIAETQKRCPSLLPKPTGVPPKLPVLHGIQHLVFDLYGTLLISGAGGNCNRQEREKQLRSLLLESGYTEQPSFLLSVHYENLIAQEHAKARKNGIPHPEVDIREIWRTFFTSLSWKGPNKLEHWILRHEMTANPISVMPGAEEILQHPKSYGVISNAQFYTPLILEALDLPTPKHCLYSYQKKHAKPGSEMFQMLARKIAPEETLYLGNDRLNDIAPAAMTGFRTALFAGDQRSYRPRPDRHDLPEPEVILTDLRQLTKILTE